MYRAIWANLHRWIQLVFAHKYYSFFCLWRLSLWWHHFPTHHHSFFCPIYSLVLSLWSSRLQTMTSIIDPTKFGKPVRVRRHVRTLTGMCYHHRSTRSSLWPQDTFPKIRAGERQMAKGWREGLERGNANYWLKVSLRHLFFVFPHDSNTTKIQMLIKSQFNLGTTLPFDPSVEVIRYQHTQMTSEPIKQQYSRSGMISL